VVTRSWFFAAAVTGAALAAGAPCRAALPKARGADSPTPIAVPSLAPLSGDLKNPLVSPSSANLLPSSFNSGSPDPSGTRAYGEILEDPSRLAAAPGSATAAPEGAAPAGAGEARPDSPPQPGAALASPMAPAGSSPGSFSRSSSLNGASVGRSGDLLGSASKCSPARSWRWSEPDEPRAVVFHGSPLTCIIVILGPALLLLVVQSLRRGPG
jgi:hypothetical protein